MKMRLKMKNGSHGQNINRINGRHFFFWDSLHARLDSHYKAWSYKKKKYKKIKAYKKSI